MLIVPLAGLGLHSAFGKGKPVSLEAHRQRLAERFRRQDANGDGYLDAKELSAPPR